MNKAELINAVSELAEISKREAEKAMIVVYAHEGLIKQHLAEKTIEKLKKALS